MSDKGKKYGTEFSSLLKISNIKFVKYNDSKSITGNKDTYLGIGDRLNRVKSVLQEMISKNPGSLGDITYQNGIFV